MNIAVSCECVPNSSRLLNMISTVGVLIIRDGMVLLVRHGDAAGHLNDTYGIPAGRVDEAESDVDAAIRELYEETGLKTDSSHLSLMPKEWRAVIQRKDGEKEFSLRVFVCSGFEGEVQASPEGIPVWIPLEAVDMYALLPNVKEIISLGKNT